MHRSVACHTFSGLCPRRPRLGTGRTSSLTRSARPSTRSPSRPRRWSPSRPSRGSPTRWPASPSSLWTLHSRSASSGRGRHTRRAVLGRDRRRDRQAEGPVRLRRPALPGIGCTHARRPARRRGPDAPCPPVPGRPWVDQARRPVSPPRGWKFRSMNESVAIAPRTYHLSQRSLSSYEIGTSRSTPAAPPAQSVNGS